VVNVFIMISYAVEKLLSQVLWTNTYLIALVTQWLVVVVVVAAAAAVIIIVAVAILFSKEEFDLGLKMVDDRFSVRHFYQMIRAVQMKAEHDILYDWIYHTEVCKPWK